jgi:formamidopyrimidine-DNA glycosylase
MPELPQVERFRAVVDRHVVGHRIERARFLDDWMLKDSDPSTAARRMRNKVVSSVDRRGKMLGLFTEATTGKADAPVLALHFGMDGRPLIEPSGEPVHRWDRLVLALDSGVEFRFRNSRRLGFVRVVTRTEFADMVWRLGPDPLEAPASYLAGALPQRDAPVKALLLDQSFVAGVGNIYADEALYAAGISPLRPGSTLSGGEIARLHSALRNVLRRAVTSQRARFPLLAIRGRASRQLGASGSPKVGCPRCTRPLRVAKIGGRTTFYCGNCQR